MNPEKPDRFDRDAAYIFAALGSARAKATPRDIAYIMRQQHRWMVRMVKQAAAVPYTNMSHDFQAGQHNAYMKVLDKLKKRAR